MAVPLKNATIVLRDLQNVFLFSFPGIIVTLFIVTRLIAGRSIRPIEKVIATAEKMTQPNINQRIGLPYHHDELYRLSATINALLDRMQDAFQREKKFTADASHELKTPLSVVKGTLEVLVRKPREKEQYESKIQFCLKELDRMALLIDQLLMLARYESNKTNPQIEEVLLHNTIDIIVSRIEPIAIKKEISFQIESIESDKVAADPAMLEMMLDNILSNAIKYSPFGSCITITVERKERTMLCHISDQGIGIPEEKLKTVFERFYRVDESRNSETGGFGLGLSIVKRLADMQHIKVSVKSAKNMGTTFTLKFPST
jgi:heavy metal sensor kinase